MNLNPSPKLITVQYWINQKFIGSGTPSPNCVRRWCRQGLISSERVGRKWYIHAGAEYHDSAKVGHENIDQMIARVSRKL